MPIWVLVLQISLEIVIRSCVASWVVTEESPVVKAIVEAVVYILKLIDLMLIMFLYHRLEYTKPLSDLSTELSE